MQPVPTDEYTLWLEPGGSEAQALKGLIEDFARRAGTPVFEPHVTVLPQIRGEEAELVEKLEAFTGSGAIAVLARGAETGALYHKCLYLDCEPSRMLTLLREKSEAAYHAHPIFHPHLSLAYGLDASLREQFSNELKERVFAFTARTVSLWHAKGLPNEWRHVASVSLV